MPLDIARLEHVTVLPVPTFLSPKAQLPVIVTVSLPTNPVAPNVQLALVVPSYSLLLQLAVGVKLFAVIFTPLFLLAVVLDNV